VGRYVSNEEARARFPNQKQRLAVAYSLFRKRNKK
jgi:hypothetical protein